MDDGEFFELSDLYEWKNTCFPSACQSLDLEKRHSDVIAVFHIKFISSILKIHDLSYLNTYK